MRPKELIGGGYVEANGVTFVVPSLEVGMRRLQGHRYLPCEEYIAQALDDLWWPHRRDEAMWQIDLPCGALLTLERREQDGQTAWWLPEELPRSDEGRREIALLARAYLYDYLMAEGERHGWVMSASTRDDGAMLVHCAVP